MPLEKLLRDSWNTNKYLQGSDDPKRPFLVEECSKAHLQRIRDLMKDDYAWASIGMIALLANESDLIGSWGEGCPCHNPASAADTRDAKQAAKLCPFKCCRAPELAVGKGLQALCQKMTRHKGAFNELLVKAPTSKRAELSSAWNTACSKLFGYSTSSVQVCFF